MYEKCVKKSNKCQKKYQINVKKYQINIKNCRTHAEELIPFPFHWTNILTSKQCSINLKKCKLDESEKQ